MAIIDLGVRDHARRKMKKNTKTGAIFVKTMNGNVYGNKAVYRANGTMVASKKGLPRKVAPKRM